MMKRWKEKNIKLSFALSIIMHIAVLFLFWSMRPEDLGIKPKEESERIRTRLVRLVREEVSSVPKENEGKVSAEEQQPAPSKTGLVKYETESTKIEFTEKLPDISMPRVTPPDIISERIVPFTEKKDKEIEIKRTGGIKETGHEEIKVKFKEPGDNLKEGLDKGEPVMFDEKIKPGFDDSFVVSVPDGRAGSQKGLSGLPGGISLDGIVAGSGKGQVVWSKKNQLPEYPAEAEKNGWEGNVGLRLAIDETGAVRRVFIEEKSGYPVLDRAAMAQARNWNIYITEGGVKIPGTVIISIPFVLKK